MLSEHQVQSSILCLIAFLCYKLKDIRDIFSSKYGFAAITIDYNVICWGHKVSYYITDIDPNAKVKEAMNHINAAKRDREAAIEEGEAEKIKIIKEAEAEAESKRLSGEGIAQQRIEIVRGFKESVDDFKKSLDTVTHEEIMQFVLMTQYFDTIKDIGANSKNSSILMPHSPGAMKDFQEQIITGTFIGNSLNDTEKENKNKK